MLSKYSVNTTLLFLFICGLFVNHLYSQKCGLSIETSIADSETVVKGASATARNQKSNRVYSSVFKQGLPYFASLPEGDYLITVKKVGFKRTIDTFSLSCGEAENGLVTTYVSMWRGASDKSVDLTSGTPKNNQAAVDTGAPKTVPKTVSGGVLNGKAISLPSPVYPPAASAARAGGAVSVQVLIDEEGNIISASAVSGHPLLRSAAETAARGAKFSPTLLEGNPVKVSGVITYNFVP